MSYMPQDLKMTLEFTPEMDLEESHILVMIFNILCGLKYLHKANVVHRDLKPANILIDEDCGIKLCDFGLSRTVPSKDNSEAPRYSREASFKQEMSSYLRKRPLNTKREVTCQVMTRYYRAPEVILTHVEYGKAVDIWSLGVILTEMMSCSSPYYKDEGYSPKKRILLQGKYCYPISPRGNG